MTRVLTGTFVPSTARPTLVKRVAAFLAMQRSRRALADLTEDQLCDIGVTRTEARTEAKRWDVPATWRN